ncbi:stress-inducible protein [Streptomyces sp. IMTB 2501]|uniref:universal stress protein n=1 Tax=Streptomyces sp. IMTB 2501 TaxID=1776340 RepID=UPI00096CF6EE|nr:universal stress protein [Streptomyces sp. IMTB 2501]OLZ73375.1 stress-inducible protein [Streptomyces sp. IMTB 2501]
MPRTITAGLDGSPESLCAAEWAAREALLRDAPLRLVHALGRQLYTYAPPGGIPQPSPIPDEWSRWADRMLREAEATIARRHPGLRITTDRVTEEPVSALLGAAGEADLLVLGSQGLGGAAGFLVGSVAQAVVAGSRRPVVLVRGGLRPEDEHQPGAFGSGVTPFRDVVLGLNSAAPNDSVIGFTFETASQRAAGLRVVHGRSPELPYYDNGGDLNAELHDELTGEMHRALSEALEPWREKFPGVDVTEQAVIGKAGSHLVEASRDASLVVIGRRLRRTPIGTGIGPVAHAVLHHATAPVAVVPHD